MLKYGAFVIVGTLGTDFMVQFAHNTGDESLSFSFGLGQGIPLWLALLCAAAGLLLLIVGGGILFAEFRRERRRRLIVIELRGLHANPDTPAVNKVVPKFRGDRRHLLLDFRPQSSGAQVDPTYMMERILSLKGTMQSLVDGVDKRDVEVAVGGLAAVPGLFLVGMLLDDEAAVHIFDWDRNIRDWRALDGPDDEVRFLPLQGLEAAKDAEDVVLVVEASYSISPTDVASTFDGCWPILNLGIEAPMADRFWSEDKQRELTAVFRDTVQRIAGQGCKRIHLLLAAPSSLSLRLGMCYDKRLFPDLFVYQFERTRQPSYPWAVEMPMNGRAPRVVHQFQHMALTVQG
jgi:uncharacterized integral membrane protein